MKIFPFLQSTQEGEPEREQKTGESQRIRLMRKDVQGLYERLPERYQLPEERYFNMFEIRNGELYYKDVDKLLTYNEGRLKTVGEIDKIFGTNRLRDLGFVILVSKVTAERAVELIKSQQEMPFASDIARVDDIELQEISENPAESTENLITQFEQEHEEILTMRELLDLDK